MALIMQAAMGFLSEVSATPLAQTRKPDNLHATFYGSTLAGSDVSPFEMSEEEVSHGRPINGIRSSIVCPDAGQKCLPLY
jgi:hypothetical protein